MSDAGLPHDGDLLLYDGECPFCRNYIALLAIRQVSPSFRVIDARRDPLLSARLLADGFNLDDGIVLRWQDSVYFAGDAIHVLSLIAENRGLSRLNRWVFKSRRRARLLYPLLRWGRNTSLALLGRNRINPATPE
jgi:predicted DCC family thiol-disulfide oxidoreductase YuxK